jgi:hypothetical protein
MKARGSLAARSFSVLLASLHSGLRLSPITMNESEVMRSIWNEDEDGQEPEITLA